MKVQVFQLMVGRLTSQQAKSWSKVALLTSWRDFVSAFWVSIVELGGRQNPATKSLCLKLGRISQNQDSSLFSKSLRTLHSPPPTIHH